MHDRRTVRPPIILLFVALPVFAQTASDTITVTATRTQTRIADTPSSVVVLPRKTIEDTAAPALDDALREVPGFTLFRRTNSRVANPTTQGASLRGIGGSGASRALVVDDGIPLNDPFGGWVYWGRVPRVALDRVEVLRGGASDLYGSTAMGGVVQFIRRKSDVPAIAADASAGSQATALGSLFAATSFGSIAVDQLNTGGYVLVDPSQRGAVDQAANSRHTAADVTFERGRGFVRASFYDESRNNGTPLQTNDTTIRQLAAGANAGALVVRAWGGDQDYRQTFSAIAPDRNSERLTVDQRVPSRSGGASAQWSHAIGATNAIVTGVEALDVEGSSDELQYAGSRVTPVSVSGHQLTLGAFAEDVIALGNLSVTAGLRFDHWHDSAVSPRLALLYRASNDLAFTASAYRGFREPTLNELYRNFRQGNVVTLANANLLPERVDGFEGGARYRNMRATLFWMNLTDVISNVTLSSTPALVTRQRQNVAASRSRGAELDGDWPVWRNLRVSAGYLFSDSVVTAGALAGKRVPQVPRHQASMQLAWSSVSTFGVQARWSTGQFDDDLNQFPLRGYFVTDVFYAHPIAAHTDITVAAENIFNQRIEAAATPVITLGQPRAFRAGVRFAR